MSALRKFSTSGLMAALGAMLFAHGLHAATLHVCMTGCTFSTIQSAIDDAVSGDIISIAPGHYLENIAVIGKRLTLAGDSTGGVTEIAAAARGPVIVLGSGTDDAYEEVDLQNLTISRGGHLTGTGVGGGIQVRRGAFLHLLNSIVTHNLAASGGGIGVNTPGGPATTIVGCLVDDNTSASPDSLGGGGIVAVQGSTVSIQQSTVTRNQAFSGGGIYTDAGTQVTLDRTTISENRVSQVHAHLGFVGGTGGGLSVKSDVSITDSTIADNTATGQELAFGGGLYIVLNGGTQTLTRTLIGHNSATAPADSGDGGGILVASPNAHDTLTLNKVYVVENQSSAGAAGGISNEGTLLLNGTVIRDNTGFNCKGGSGCPP